MPTTTTPTAISARMRVRTAPPLCRDEGQPEMMNASTNPNSASASVNAMPRNIVVRTVPADSGWRAIAVMALPTTRPMPMPGPMAAPPYTMPRPIAVRPFVLSVTVWAWASRRWSRATWVLLLVLSVLGVHGTADVHGGEDREDERLQEADEDLE